MARRSPSPSYSPPPQLRRRSPSYSPPRIEKRWTHDKYERSPDRRGYNSNGKRSFKRSRTRSKSPRRNNEYSRYPDPYKRSRDRSSSRERKVWSPPPKPIFDFEGDDDEARITFCCKHCDVKLHDLDSIESHLQGKPHLMQQQRLKDNALRVGTGYGIKARNPLGKVEYDSSFRQRERGPKHLEPEQKRWLDEKGLDKLEPKFKVNSYDKGQFNTSNPEFHCEPCGVWVKQRDQMQAHKEGKNHKKKCEKVIRHHCEICLIDVTCKETLENHKQGKDHVKREKQLEMQRRRMRERENDSEGSRDDMEGFGAEALQTLEESNKKNRELEQKVKILQSQVKTLQDFKKHCLNTHEAEDFRELLEYKNWCISTHQRPVELQKPGLHCKQEREPSPNQPSTSHSGFKSEKRRSYHESNSDEEHLGRNYKSERKSPDRRNYKSERRSRSPGRRREGFKTERRSDETVKEERRPDEGGSWHTPNVENDHRDERQEYMETEVNLKSESKEEYVEKEAGLKSEVSETDDDIIFVE